MVPVLIVAGLLAGLVGAGRPVTVIAAVAWPALLIATDVDSGWAFAFAAGVVGTVNTLVGVVVGSLIRGAVVRVTGAKA